MRVSSEFAFPGPRVIWGRISFSKGFSGGGVKLSTEIISVVPREALSLTECKIIDFSKVLVSLLFEGIFSKL